MNNLHELIKFYSVTLSVANAEKSAEWYTEKLGVREVKRKTYEEFKTKLIFLELNNFHIELIGDGNAKEGPNREDPPAHTAFYGISQFAFETEDLAAVKAELEKKNVSIIFEFENAELSVKFFFIRDLDGNLVQFLQSLNPRRND